MRCTPRCSTLLVLVVLVTSSACGGGDGTSTTADTRGNDTPTVPDATGEATDDAASDALPDVPPTFEAIAGAPTPGTYVLATEAVELTVRITDGRVFVLRSKAGCKGGAESPCVFERPVPLLTCSTSYEKGYTAPLIDNHAVVPIKEDSLELWVTAPGKLEGFYHLTPGKCCEAHPVVALTNTDATVCEDYEIPDCDPYAGTGCPDAQHCVFDDQGPYCLVDGPVLLGGACNFDDKICAEGNCINFVGVGARCYRYCKGSADCQGLGCIELASATYKVCQLLASSYDEPCAALVAPCSKAGQSCCRTALATAPICLPAGTTEEGGGCQLDEDCGPGLWCELQACRPWCRFGGGDPACADAFAECRQVYGDVGVCIGQ